MWKLIRSIFGGSPTGAKQEAVPPISDHPQADFDTIKSEVEEIMKLDFTSEAARESNAGSERLPGQSDFSFGVDERCRL